MLGAGVCMFFVLFCVSVFVAVSMYVCVNMYINVWSGVWDVMREVHDVLCLAGVRVYDALCNCL